MVLSERDDASISALGSVGTGGGGCLNFAVAACDVDGRAPVSPETCFEELGIASDDEGRLSSSANGRDLSAAKSKKKSDRCVF